MSYSKVSSDFAIFCVNLCNNLRLNILFFSFFIFHFSYSQTNNLINQNANQIIINDSTVLSPLFNKLDSLTMFGIGKVNILHIGDSHIQADYFSNTMRLNFQQYFAGGVGDRGFVFPYSIAKSNNPYTYKFEHTGKWTRQKCLRADSASDIGIAGYSVSTSDSSSSIKYIPRSNSSGSNIITIFHNQNHYNINLNSKKNIINKLIKTPVSTIFYLSDFLDTVDISIIKQDTVKSIFTLYGILLYSDCDGITYSSIGVNGADINSYNHCRHFGKQLAMIRPDMIILSLGTNDAFTKQFNPDRYLTNYKNLVDTLRRYSPQALIILTTPGDAVFRKKPYNLNLFNISNTITTFAATNNYPLWDLYNVMGGKSSILKWYKAGLSAKDKVHFSGAGYRLQASAFFDSFINLYILHFH